MTSPPPQHPPGASPISPTWPKGKLPPTCSPCCWPRPHGLSSPRQPREGACELPLLSPPGHRALQVRDLVLHAARETLPAPPRSAPSAPRPPLTPLQPLGPLVPPTGQAPSCFRILAWAVAFVWDTLPPYAPMAVSFSSVTSQLNVTASETRS